MRLRSAFVTSLTLLISGSVLGCLVDHSNNVVGDNTGRDASVSEAGNDTSVPDASSMGGNSGQDAGDGADSLDAQADSSADGSLSDAATKEDSAPTDSAPTDSAPTDSAPTDALSDVVQQQGCMSEVASGIAYTCGVKKDRTLWCWGTKEHDLTNTHSNNAVLTPRQLTDPAEHIRWVASGYHQTCAVAVSGAVYCWGANDAGQLGVSPTFDQSTHAVKVQGIPSTCDIQHLDMGCDHTCVICSSNELYCWGSNGSGQLTGSNSYKNQATQLLSGHQVHQIALGGFHTCAIVDTSHSLECWGSNSDGQLGNGTWSSSNSPVSVNGIPGSQVFELAAGGYHTCALVNPNNPMLYCWGLNDDGQLGVEDEDKVHAPVNIDLSALKDAKPVSLSLGCHHTCLLDDHGRVWCWGKINDTDHPTLVTGLPNAFSISARGTHTCAIAGTNRELYCWGANGKGQLGNGTTNNSDKAIHVNAICDKL